MTMKSKIYVAQGKDAGWRVVDKETVILNMKTSYYYTLSDTGTKIWRLFNGKNTLEQIVKKIASDYSVPEKNVEKDISKLVNELKKENLVETSSTPIAQKTQL